MAKISFLPMKISKKTTIFIILVVFFVALDRLLKTLCLKGFFNQPLSLVGDIFSLHFIKNYYIAFSLPLGGLILNIITGIIILILLAYWLKLFKQSLIQNNKYQTLNTNLCALTTLIIGAIINFTDRLQFGFVVDYFDLKWFTVFNLGDIMISGSVLFIILSNLRKN
jgi:signal peptidase II